VIVLPALKELKPPAVQDPSDPFVMLTCISPSRTPTSFAFQVKAPFQ
jgi:hypothetical protein